jgi:hypothetical protein
LKREGKWLTITIHPELLHYYWLCSYPCLRLPCGEYFFPARQYQQQKRGLLTI